MLNVKFNAKEAHVPNYVLEKMEKKIALRLSKYFKNDSADTEALVKITEKKPIVKVELTLPYYGYQLRSETSGRDGETAALDKCLDTMERQMEKCKTKVKKSKRTSASPAQEDTSLPDTDDRYRVVKVKSYVMKPMSAQEAILQMELLGHSFYMFFNSGTNSMCTVYLRHDGDYGLIESENS